MRRSQIRGWATWLWAPATFGIYLLVRPSNRGQAADAFDYAAAVERASFGDLVYPLHVLYLPIVRLFHSVLERVGAVESAFSTFGLMGAGIGTAAIWGVFRFARDRLELPASNSFLAAGCLAVSWGFWRYSAEAEVYSFAVLAAIVTLLVVSRPAGGVAHIIGIASSITLAVLAHVLNVALIPFAVVLLRSREWAWKKIVSIGVVAGAMGAAAFYLAFILAAASDAAAADAGFLAFYLDNAQESTFRAQDLVTSVAVAGSTAVAANFLFGYGPVRDLIVRVFPGQSIDDDLLMGETAAPWISWIAPISLATFFVLAVLLLFRYVSARTIKTRIGAGVASWLVAYSAIVLAGGNTNQPEVWIIWLLPAALLLAVLAVRGQVSSSRVSVLVLCLGVHSIVGGFSPLFSGENRMDTFGSWIVTNGREGDLVLTADSPSTARFIAYEAALHAAHLGLGPSDRAVARIDSVSRLISSGAPTSAIVAELANDRAIEGHMPRPPNQEGVLYVTQDLFDPPRWLVVSRPDTTAALVAMAETTRHLFEPVPGSEIYLRRITDSR